MHLWNDYEGTTLAGQWKLGHLLRTEGRSALFATTRKDGKIAVLRLTESLNDQAVLHARYQAIQAAGDQYLITVEGYGDVEFNGTPLSYAVLEPTQESLAEIVAQRHLAPEEAHEVAIAVAGGLQALHGQGLVHGLVEPESVLAAGDRIKLRSDCARFAPQAEDAMLEGAVTPQTDAFGLADILCQSLTGNRLHDASDALALPEPFSTIVRHTARGAWGVSEIGAELVRYHRAHAPAVPAVAPPREPLVAASAPPIAPALSAGKAPPATSAAAVPVVSVWEAAPPESPSMVSQPLSSRAAVAKLPDEPTTMRGNSLAHEESTWQQPERVSSQSRRGVFIALGTALLLLLLFLLFHHSAKRATAAPQTGRATASLPAPAPAPVRPGGASSPAASALMAAPSNTASASTVSTPPSDTKIWRVVAYTYNRQNEAASKAASLNQRFPKFHAQAWSRTGQRPFFVTLGGPMPKQQAFELRALARHAGVSRDVFAQNYSR